MGTDLVTAMEAMYFGDGIENMAANLAVGKSKLAGDGFVARDVTISELTSMYRSDWMSRKIVDIPVRDALRRGRNWQASPEMIEALEAQEKRFGTRAKAALAATWARLYGGAGIFIHTGDASPQMPLRRVQKNGLRNLVVLHRRELNAVDIEDDPRSPGFRLPTMYQINTGSGGHAYVHPSRVIRFDGLDRPDFESNSDGWGDSILQVVYEAVHHAALTHAGVAELVHEAKLDIINVKGLSVAASTPTGSQAIVKRFTLANMMKSINNTLLLDSEEEWNRRQTSFAGLPDVIKAYLQIVAGAADIPATRLLGSSPGGLNSTGESDLTNYYDAVSSYREDKLRPAFERIDDVLAQDAGGDIHTDAWWEFGPLWEPTEKERAEIAEKKAGTTQKYVNMGLFPQEALLDVVSNQLIEDGTYPGLEQSLAKIRSAIASEIEAEAEIAALEADRSARGLVP